MNSQSDLQKKLGQLSEQIALKLKNKVSAQPKTNEVDPSDFRLFLKNLHPETTEETLYAYFGRWGEIADIFIRKGKHNFAGIRCNMAYITFKSYFKESPMSAYIHVIDGQV